MLTTVSLRKFYKKYIEGVSHWNFSDTFSTIHYNDLAESETVWSCMPYRHFLSRFETIDPLLYQKHHIGMP